MDWLCALGASPIRLNGEDLDRGLDLKFRVSPLGFQLRVASEGSNIDFLKARAVWCRRWRRKDQAWYRKSNLAGIGDHGMKNHSSLVAHLDQEIEVASHLLFWMLKRAKWLSPPIDLTSLKKPEVLLMAVQCGLDVPDTIVTTSRTDVIEFCERHAAVVTKPLSNPLTLLRSDGTPLFSYTADLTPASLEALPQHFFPCYLQERLEKSYELRTFVLDGRCWSMAIFSQGNVQSQTDFRRATTNSSRVVPYNLPHDVEDAIRRLMRMLNLDTGSLDFVRTVEGRTVFLEVNPVGQFGMVSKPCNYHLEKCVAEALIRRACD